MKLTDDDIRIIKIGNNDVRKLSKDEFMRLQDLMQQGRKGGAFNKAVKKLNLSGGGLATKKYVNPVKVVDNRKKKNDT